MKIFKKILAVILVLVFVIFLFLQFALPPIAANYIEKHSNEWIGRQVKIKDFHWNLLALEIHLNGFSLLEQDAKAEFLGWDNLSLNISPLALLTKTAKLQYFTLNGFRANVVQQGDQFNFSDILSRFSADASKDSILDSTTVIEVQNINDSTTINTSKSDSLAPSFTNPLQTLPIYLLLENINIQNTSVSYTDLKLKRNLSVQEIQVKIPKFSSKKPETSVIVSAKFPQGGTFDLNTDLNLDNGKFKVETSLDEFDLQNVYSIAASILQIDSLKGKVNFNILADGSLEAPLATKIDGQVKVKEVEVLESAGGSYKLEKFETGFSGISLEENKIPIDSLVIQGVNAHFDILPKTTNVALLLKQTKDSTNSETPNDSNKISEAKTAKTETTVPSKESEKMPDVSLKKLSISDVAFTLNDYSIKKPMHYTIQNIKVSGENIDMQKMGIAVSLNFPKSGTLSMNFRGSPSDLTTMNLNLKISQMALQPFSPYSIHYTGFPLKKGTLDFSSDTDIKNNNLNSVNKVLIHKLEVDDKLKNIEPEFSIPMKVGLYLLKDRKDQISIDLPVKGNITDPEFSFGKIIWKTFSNLIIKVALTPTKLLTAPVDAILGDSTEEASNTSQESTQSQTTEN